MQKKPRRTSRGSGEAFKTTPIKTEKVENATQQNTDGEEEATPQESDGKTSEEAPKKSVRARKTPSKKTPAKRTPGKKTPAPKTPTADGGLPAGKGGVVDAPQQENGKPKPKRQYVKKQHRQTATPVTEPPCEEAPGEHPAEPEEEIEPGGRRRRGAAKA